MFGSSLARAGLCLIAMVSLPRSASSGDGYRELVDRYLSGDRVGAVYAIAHWSGDTLLESIEEAIATFERFPKASAAMLHTERALVDINRLAADSAELHLDLAELLLEAGADDGFRARWCLAVGLGYMQLLNGEAARLRFERGLEWAPGDPELLTARGSSLELLAALEQPLTGSGPSQPNDREYRRLAGRHRDHLEEARRSYRAALEGAPDHAEARLRLGRLLVEDGTEDGLEQLEWVVSHAEESDLVYLAQLLIGRERERTGERTKAIERFRAAHDVEPRGQVALFALSHALFLEGDSAGSEDALERALATRGGGRGLARRAAATAGGFEVADHADPWRVYLNRRAALVPELIRGLREEATRR